MQLRTLAHSLIVGPQRAFVHKLSTRSALGAFPARCWTCSGCQQPAIFCAGGKNYWRGTHREHLHTHTHRQLSSVRRFSPHTLPSAVLATCATSEESQRERVILYEGEREREKDTESVCRRERVTRRSLVLPTHLSPPAAHLGQLPQFGRESARTVSVEKKTDLFEEARRDGDWCKGRGARPRRRLLLHPGAI